MDFHSSFKHRWINPKAKSFNSKIDKLGVQAISDVKKGEIVSVLGGVIVPKSEIEKIWKEIGHVGIQIDEDFFICPTSREELGETGVFNHSCEPNAGFKSSIVLEAIRDIKAGEEITFDYSFNETYFEPFACKCGASNCRKTIKSTDWQIKEIQEKYSNHFSPYLKTKI